MTLEEWRSTRKPMHDLIVQASIPDGSSRNEKFDFPIGACYHFASPEVHNAIREHVEFTDRDHLLFCCFKTHTHASREVALRNIERLKDVHPDFCNKHVDPSKFLPMMLNSKFVVSPRGNGVDCHRHYEALLCGSIPIIPHDPDMKRKYANLPVLWTTDYSEITPDYLRLKYIQMMKQRYDFSNLFVSNYTPANQTTIKAYGNFWCQRLTGSRWYP